MEFSLTSTRFDEDYSPQSETRRTTNFANLARGARRLENLRNTFAMIDHRFNELARDDNEDGDRYSLELDIVSVSVDVEGDGIHDGVPLIEILQTTILDRQTGKRTPGIVGNNFSSYVRDYDFSILLPSGRPADFGELHGNLFKSFVRSDCYTQNFAKPPVICLSVSTSRSYSRTENTHPVLGTEYRQSEYSPTDAYFAKMGLSVRYFMPPNSVAPLAFYHLGDLPGDYTDLELAGLIGTMETFQKIYRPEIYNANSAAGESYRPSLSNADFSPTSIAYDREERSRLALEQGRFAEEHFIMPHRAASTLR